MKRYWRGKEDERIAPRVHQGGLSVDEKILRHFDLSSQFGVCWYFSSVRSFIHSSLSDPGCVSVYVHMHAPDCRLFHWQRAMLIIFFGGTALHRDPAHEAMEAGREPGTQAAGRGASCALKGGEEREWQGGEGVYGGAVDE